jgi:hypothetical protein
MKAFYLCRHEDVSNTSGTGRVAEVVQFADGSVAVRWVAAMNATRVASTTVFNSLEDLLRVHGHEGKTILEPVLDDEGVRKIEDRVKRLEQSLGAALALLDGHGIAVPEEIRKAR